MWAGTPGAHALHWAGKCARFRFEAGDYWGMAKAGKVVALRPVRGWDGGRHWHRRPQVKTAQSSQ